MSIKFFLATALAALAIVSLPAPKKKWVAIGDSITYLNDHTNETGNRVTKGYLTAVTEILPDLEYVNKGYNGWTARRIADKFDELSVPKADVYTIFLGTNDWWAGLPIGKIEDYSSDKGNTSLYAAFRIIIDKVRGLNSNAKIILITPMQRADFVYINDPHNNAWGSYRTKADQWLEDFAKAIIEIGKLEKLPVLDLYHDNRLELKKLIEYKRLKVPGTDRYYNYSFPAYSSIDFNPETDEYPYPESAIEMTYDGLHPSDKGNKIIASLLAPMIEN